MKAHAANARSGGARQHLNGAAHQVTSTKRAKREREYLYAEGPTKSLRILLERAAARLEKQIARAKVYGLPENLYIVPNLQHALDDLRMAIQGLNQVPADWQPARGSIGGTVLSEGSLVTLREKFQSTHIEMADTTAPMRVVRVVGGKTVCEVLNGPDKGTKLVIQRTHLEQEG